MITTHILDTSRGKPASDVSVRLEAATQSGQWQSLSECRTDQDGRIKNFPCNREITPGIYRLIFSTDAYYQSRETSCFYPEVTIAFRIDQCEHYHVPLLLNPYGYSTYRGS